MKRASSAVKEYGASSTGTGPSSTLRCRPLRQRSKTATTPMNTQDMSCGSNAAQPARMSISTLAYLMAASCRSRGAAFQRGLLLEPLGLELRELPADVGLLEQQRLQVVLALVGVDRRIAQARVDVHLLRVQPRHQLFEPLDAGFQAFARPPANTRLFGL